MKQKWTRIMNSSMRKTQITKWRFAKNAINKAVNRFDIHAILPNFATF